MLINNYSKLISYHDKGEATVLEVIFYSLFADADMKLLLLFLHFDRTDYA